VWITYWETDHYRQHLAFYLGIYATLGVAGGGLMFVAGVVMAQVEISASKHFYLRALKNLFASPMSYFHTTPAGRIMGFMGQDINAIDNTVGPTMAALLGLLVAVSS
jgi:ABC-type multidrug transport system fused ATPase/permease subunit